jgi:hypothetical protein
MHYIRLYSLRLPKRYVTSKDDDSNRGFWFPVLFQSAIWRMM